MRRSLIAVMVAAAMAVAAPARADWLLTPYLGVTFGGDTPDQQVNYGLSAAFLGKGVFGVEVDAAITPNFFGAGDAVDIQDSNVSTFMVNLMLAAPSSTPGLRPYASGGVGIVHARATSVGNVFDLNANNLGVNVGGGLIGQFTDRVGLRGDIRYFRNLQDSDAGDDINLDLGSFNFWRGTLGVTFRF